MDIAINNNDAAGARAGSPAIIVAFIVSGGHESAMGFRARDLATRLSQYDVHIAYRTQRKLVSILNLFIFLTRLRPTAIYVFDISYTSILSAGFYKLFSRACLLIETGDAIAELTRSSGSRGKLLLWLTDLLERTAFKIADRIVCRGSFHREWLAEQGIEADVIQDGVDTRKFTPDVAGDLRKQYELEGKLTVGLLGSSIWSEKLQMCYGWELVELLRLLDDSQIKGIMIGGGSGIDHLKARCREYGIEGRIIFLDHVPYDQLPAYLNLIDVCLSTQTNDLVGAVRTTGKLPLYLAAGRYILASDVGEAGRVLEPEMLVPYEGVKDELYPQKLAARVRNLLDHPEMLARGNANVSIAKEYFEYSLLAKRAGDVIEAAVAARREKR